MESGIAMFVWRHRFHSEIPCCPPVSNLRASSRSISAISVDPTMTIVNHKSHGSGSAVTDPSARLIPTPQRRDVWPLGNGSALISSTW